MSIKSFAVLPVTLAFACGGSLPAVVAGDEVPQGSHVNMSIPTSEDDALAQDLAKVLIEAESVPPDGQLRTTGSLRWKVTKESSQELSLMGREQGYAPQFRVTAGWYLYLYLNTDISGLEWLSVECLEMPYAVRWELRGLVALPV